MLDIEELARKLSGESGGPYMAWLDAFSEAKTLQNEARLGKSELLLLARESGDPGRFAQVMEALAEYGKEHPEGESGFTLLCREVDESPYSLGEWLEALEYFYGWLGQNGRVSPGFLFLLQYLSCCVEAGGGNLGYPLSGILEQMLDQYGFQST